MSNFVNQKMLTEIEKDCNIFTEVKSLLLNNCRSYNYYFQNIENKKNNVILGGEIMPIISQFYGIIVSMYFDDKNQYNLPHIHVRYNEHRATYDFDANLLNGKLPIKQTKLLEAWIIIHKEELITLWKLMEEEGRMFKIKPL